MGFMYENTSIKAKACTYFLVCLISLYTRLQEENRKPCDMTLLVSTMNELHFYRYLKHRQMNFYSTITSFEFTYL